MSIHALLIKMYKIEAINMLDFIIYLINFHIKFYIFAVHCNKISY